MEKVIASCGLNCATCDARTATITGNDELRMKTAETWSKQFNAPITPEMINCTGCTADGPKFHHCSVCEIRNCAKSKGFGFNGILCNTKEHPPVCTRGIE